MKEYEKVAGKDAAEYMRQHAPDFSVAHFDCGLGESVLRQVTSNPVEQINSALVPLRYATIVDFLSGYMEKISSILAKQKLILEEYVKEKKEVVPWVVDRVIYLARKMSDWEHCVRAVSHSSLTCYFELNKFGVEVVVDTEAPGPWTNRLRCSCGYTINGYACMHAAAVLVSASTYIQDYYDEKGVAAAYRFTPDIRPRRNIFYYEGYDTTLALAQVSMQLLRPLQFDIVTAPEYALYPPKNSKPTGGKQRLTPARAGRRNGQRVDDEDDDDDDETALGPSAPRNPTDIRVRPVIVPAAPVVNRVRQRCSGCGELGHKIVKCSKVTLQRILEMNKGKEIENMRVVPDHILNALVSDFSSGKGTPDEMGDSSSEEGVEYSEKEDEDLTSD